MLRAVDVDYSPDAAYRYRVAAEGLQKKIQEAWNILSEDAGTCSEELLNLYYANERINGAKSYVRFAISSNAAN